jgi:hypothetical protein
MKKVQYIMALSSSDPQMAINLSMKQGSLFCFVVMRSTEPQDASDCVLGVFGKLSHECMGLVP